MKALSIRQPWAAAILYSGKDVENRKWGTRYRGPILIHAGKKEEITDTIWLRRLGRLAVGDELCQRGGFVGWAVISGVSPPGVLLAPNLWRDIDQYGIRIAEAEPLPFLPWPGALGIFDVAKADLLAKAQAALDPAGVEVWEQLLLLRGET